MRIVSKGDTGTAGAILLGIGITLVVIGLVLLVILTTVTVIIGGVLLLVGGGMTAFGIRGVRIAGRLEPGTLDLPTPGPLRLDDRIDATFHRRVKKGASDAQLVAEMRLIEWVRYQAGTQTRTATRTVQRLPVGVAPFPDPTGIAGHVQLVLPSYPPTFSSSDNRLTWELHVDATFADGFTEDSVFEIPIVPETVVIGPGAVGPGTAPLGTW